MYYLSQKYSDPYVPKGVFIFLSQLSFFCLSPTLQKEDTLSLSPTLQKGHTFTILTLPHCILQGYNTSAGQRLLECHCKG